MGKIAETVIVLTEEDLEGYGVDVEELSEVLSEAISDITEYCHTGFTYEIKITAKLDKSN